MGQDTHRETRQHLGVYAAMLVRTATRLGVSERSLLEGTGLDLAQLVASGARVDDDVMYALSRRALSLTKEPALGFHLGRASTITAHGSVGIAAMTASTLGDAFAIVTRFFELRSGHCDLRYEYDDEQCAVELVPAARIDGIESLVFESLFAGLAGILELLLDRPLRCSIELGYPEPKHFAGHAHLFPGPARFDRPRYRMLFPAHQLALPIRLADDFASREAIARCEAELASLRATSTFLGTIRRQVKNRDRGFLSLTELADAHGVSVRTMKRRLESHGVSFQTLLDELRRDRALFLLEQDATSVDAVAAKLGYADTANFRRAFKRWMGQTPSEWRDSAR